MKGRIRRHYRKFIRMAAFMYFFLFCAGFLQSFIGAEEMREGLHIPPWISRILTFIGTDGMPVLMIFDRAAESKEARERGIEIEAHPPHGACEDGVRDRQA